MKFPPRWVFEIWKQKKHGFGPLRICGTEGAELKKVIGQTRMLYGYTEELTEKIVSVAWALYISDEEDSDGEGGLLSYKTKFAFAGFLKAGAGHIVAANDLIADLQSQRQKLSKHWSDEVQFALAESGFVQK